MPQNPPRNLQEAESMGGKPVVPRNLQEAEAMGAKPVAQPEFMDRLKAFGKGALAEATRSRLPAETELRKILPKERVTSPVRTIAGPRGLGVRQTDPDDTEQAMGMLLGGARTVETLGQPVTAAMGLGAGLLSSVGLPGMVMGAGFSADMLKNAYANYQQAMTPDPGALPREETASKTAALAEALLALMPWLKTGREVIANRKQMPGVLKEQAMQLAPRPSNWLKDLMRTQPAAKPPSLPSTPSVAPVPPAVPKVAAPPNQGAVPTSPPALPVRPEAVQAKASAVTEVSKPAYVPEAAPWYQKALRNTETEAIARAEYQRKIEAMKPPEGWGPEPTPRPPRPVGEIGLQGEAGPPGQLPPMPPPAEGPFPWSKAEGLPYKTKADLIAERKEGLLRKLKAAGGVNVESRGTEMKVSAKGKSARFIQKKGFQMDFGDPQHFRDAFSPSELSRVVNKQGKGVKPDELLVWAKENGFEGFKSNEEVLDFVLNPKKRNITPDQMNNPSLEMGPEMIKEWAQYIKERKATEEKANLDELLDFFGRGGEEGFADVGPRGKKKVGNLLRLNIKDDPNFPDSHVLVQVESRGKVYGMRWAKPAPSREEVMQTWRENRDSFRPYNQSGDSFSVGKLSGQEGFARIKKDKNQPGFGFMAAENPLLKAAEGPDPIKKFHDEAVQAVDQSRQGVKKEFFNKILQAPESGRMSKREMLGLDKKKSSVSKQYDNLDLFGYKK